MRHRKNGQHLSHQRESLNMTAIETAPQKSKKRVRGDAMQRFAKACSRVMRDNSDELAAALFRRATKAARPLLANSTESMQPRLPASFELHRMHLANLARKVARENASVIAACDRTSLSLVDPGVN
jgi:hypothetical protein